MLLKDANIIGRKRTANIIPHVLGSYMFDPNPHTFPKWIFLGQLNCLQWIGACIATVLPPLLALALCLVPPALSLKLKFINIYMLVSTLYWVKKQFLKGLKYPCWWKIGKKLLALFLGDKSFSGSRVYTNSWNLCLLLSSHMKDVGNFSSFQGCE